MRLPTKLSSALRGTYKTPPSAMKPARTAAENKAFWLARAKQYEREAITVPASRPSHYDYWMRRAAEARAHAETYAA
jgi:hypothetical protein